MNQQLGITPLHVVIFFSYQAYSAKYMVDGIRSREEPVAKKADHQFITVWIACEED